MTRIHSVAGVYDGGRARGAAALPGAAPHDLGVGLVGGGAVPVPGEASLAHNGVLFLDELSEFNRGALEALRQPLEDGRVAIVRGQRTALYPTRFMLVAATNPCPCGFAGDDVAAAAREADLARHRRRLSGPLLDRLDLLVHVDEADRSESVLAVSVGRVRARVWRRASDTSLAAHGRRLQRARCRSALRGRPPLGWRPTPSRSLADAYRDGHPERRGHARVLRVARTIADSTGRDHVERTPRPESISPAPGLRVATEAAA